MHFLTDLDPNERVKGSRDPLGIQSVWSRFARLVIGGITSQTAVLDDFRILVVGSWLLDQLDEKVPDAAAFVCWEQLASYARLGIAHEAPCVSAGAFDAQLIVLLAPSGEPSDGPSTWLS